MWFKWMVHRLVGINLLIGALLYFSRYWSSTPDGEPSRLYHQIIAFFSFSNELWHNVTHPWVLITANFGHTDPIRCLWNVLGIYWFGQMLRLSQRQILTLYLGGGSIGLITFFAFRQISFYQQGVPTYFIGADWSMLAMLAAATQQQYNTWIKINFIGSIKLMYISILMLILHVISTASYLNESILAATVAAIIFGYKYAAAIHPHSFINR